MAKNELHHISDSIHDYRNTVSASDIGLKQYLLLRAIRPEREDAYRLVNTGIPWLGEEYREQAKQHLEKQSDWKAYLDSIGKTGSSEELYRGLGTFTLVRQSQLSLFDTPSESVSGVRKLEFSPKTRSWSAAKASEASPSTPTPSRLNPETGLD